MAMSPFERFRMGGTGINGFNFILGTDIVSLRGYTQDALYPDNVGGIIYDKLVTELRYPIVTEGVATIYGFGLGRRAWVCERYKFRAASILVGSPASAMTATSRFSNGVA